MFGPYFAWLVFTGDYLEAGEIHWDGDDVEWSWDTSWSWTEPNLELYRYCREPALSNAWRPYEGNIYEGDLPCERYLWSWYGDETYEYFVGGRADVWSFDGSAGDTLSVTVDTVAPNTAFVPDLWLNTPEDCTDLVAYGEVRCTYGGEHCPSARTRLARDGPYQLIVASTSWCASSRAEYELTFDLD